MGSVVEVDSGTGGWVRAWEVDTAVSSSGLVRKWLRRGVSGCGGLGMVAVLIPVEEGVVGGVSVSVDVAEMPSGETSTSAAPDREEGGSAVSNDSTKGVVMPRIGSPRASALCCLRTA